MHHLHRIHLKIPTLHWMVRIPCVELRMSVTFWCVGSRDRLCEYLFEEFVFVCDSGRISRFALMLSHAVTRNANVATCFETAFFMNTFLRGCVHAIIVDPNKLQTNFHGDHMRVKKCLSEMKG